MSDRNAIDDISAHLNRLRTSSDHDLLALLKLHVQPRDLLNIQSDVQRPLYFENLQVRALAASIADDNYFFSDVDLTHIASMSLE